MSNVASNFMPPFMLLEYVWRAIEHTTTMHYTAVEGITAVEGTTAVAGTRGLPMGLFRFMA